MRYAELHCLSSFSFQRGASHARELVERAREVGYEAIAITDECSMAGIVRAHQAAKAAKLRLIVGTEVRLDDGLKLVLLAPDHDAYSGLCALITQGRRAAGKGGYYLTRDDVARHCTQALALWIPERDTDAPWVTQTFGERAWIAAEIHRQADDPQRIARLRGLAARSGLRIVAAGDVHMHVRERRALQDVMTAIRIRKPVAECGHALFPNGERHLRTLREIGGLYQREWTDEAAQIAQRCTFTLDELRYEYPHEVVGEGHTATSALRELTEAGLRRRWPAGTPAHVRALVEKELALVQQLKYEHFFLTVEDIVRFARSRNILCQGRGSAANSAVCYALGITEVDPARMNMLFERFVSKERDEPPDIDVDFEHQRREEVIQYVYNKYGRARAAIAATVIHYRPRLAIRDVGFALGQPPDIVDRFAGSMAWWDDAKQLPERLRELGLDPGSRDVQLWMALVRALLDFPRHLSQHVGGFVVSDSPLSQLVPVENASMPDRTIIQWDKDDLEALGLLKVDVLALGMLSAIRRALELVSQRRGAPFAMQDVPAEDPATYAMIRRAETIGVFQIESRAQMSMLPRLKPRTFYDLVIEVAIVRPGPIQGGMVHPYLRRRNGEEAEDYPSEALRRVLGRTKGVPLFQEQVIEICIVAAGFTPGEADQVRRSMAAWKRNGGLEPIRERLFAGMAARGYTQQFAEDIFEMIKGFGSYGFPESHAASFALLAYVSSWLKCHEPAAFTAALLNSQPMGFYAPAQLVGEARRAGVAVLPVDVQVSDWDCTLESEFRVSSFEFREKAPSSPWSAGESPSLLETRNSKLETASLRLGLRLVAGLSEAAGKRIEAARAQAPFADVEELVHRARLDARERRLLADADALRALAGDRHHARWTALGVENLPGMLAGHAAVEPPLELRAPREGEDIVADYAATRLTLRRHPVELLRPRLAKLQITRARDLDALPDRRAIRVAGIVINRQRPQTANGTVFMTLEDETGFHNLIVWSKVLERHRAAVLGARLLIVTGQLQKADGVTHVVAQRFEDATGWLGELQTASRDFH